MPNLSTKERKAKLRVPIKEFDNEFLDLVKIQDKMEKIYSINEQQVIETDKVHDEIWKFHEPTKNLEILLEATKEKIRGLQAEL